MDIDRRLHEAGHQWRQSQGRPLPTPQLDTPLQKTSPRWWMTGLTPLAASAAVAAMVIGVVVLRDAPTGQRVPVGATTTSSPVNSPRPKTTASTSPQPSSTATAPQPSSTDTPQPPSTDAPHPSNAVSAPQTSNRVTAPQPSNAVSAPQTSNRAPQPSNAVTAPQTQNTVASPPTTVKAASPTLGQAAGAFDHGRGFGLVRPSEVFNGGDPTGLVTKIVWNSWGGPRAVGTGISTYVGPNQHTFEGTQQPVTIVAFNLGTCDGKAMYRAVEWYFPQHGQLFDPNTYEDICTGTYVGSR